MRHCNHILIFIMSKLHVKTVIVRLNILVSYAIYYALTVNYFTDLQMGRD